MWSPPHSPRLLVTKTESPVSLDPDLPAHVENRTGGASGQVAGTDVLAEGHEEGVELDPIPRREPALQLGQGPLGRRSADEAPLLRSHFVTAGCMAHDHSIEDTQTGR